jgi:hypothetical protein
VLLSRSPLKLKGRGRRWILSSHRSKAVAAKCCVIQPRLEPVPYWLNCFPGSLLRAVRAQGQQAAAPAADSLAAVRAQIGTVPIQTQKLADNLTLLSGPGGNVVVLNGADGKFVVDTFLAPSWPRLKESLSSLGDAPLKLVIDTHWHFDRPTARCRRHDSGPRKHQDANV